MSYRKLFLLIAFAPLAVFVRSRCPALGRISGRHHLGLYRLGREAVSNVPWVLTTQRYRLFRRQQHTNNCDYPENGKNSHLQES